MPLVDIVRDLADTRVADEDGNEHVLETSPPLSAEEIDAIERGLPCRLPENMRALLGFARGFANGPLESFDFGGLPGAPFEFPEVFPNGVPIAHDGFGNYWVVDLTPASMEWGPMFYACHDAPVMVYQCDNLAQFLEDFRELVTPPHEGPIDWVHEQAVPNVWDNDPGVISRPAALASGDSELRAFAESLDDSWSIVDLRDAVTGDGFAWGRYGPRTVVRRHGYERIFAYQFKSWWQRLLGR